MTAMTEIAKLKTREDKSYTRLAKRAFELSERVTYGIRRDAVSLTRVRGIGRKRARILLEHGIRDAVKLGSMTANELSKIPGFGAELSKNVLEAAKAFGHPANKEDPPAYVNGDVSDYLL
jgi:helicase